MVVSVNVEDLLALDTQYASVRLAQAPCGRFRMSYPDKTHSVKPGISSDLPITLLPGGIFSYLFPKRRHRTPEQSHP